MHEEDLKWADTNCGHSSEETVNIGKFFAKCLYGVVLQVRVSYN